jgi:hypothetical protein
MANYQFPMEGMMGPSTPIDRITAGSSMFGTGGPTAGEQVLADEARGKYFQELLNRLKGASPQVQAGAAAAAPVLGGIAKYGAAAAPGVANIAGGLTGGGLGQTLTGAAQVGVGTVATRAAAPVGAAVTRGAAALLPGPAKLAAPLIGGATQAALGTAAAGGVGLLAQIPGAIASGFKDQGQREREAGQTPGILPGQGQGVGLANLPSEQKAILDLLRGTGQISVEQARAMMPIANEMKNADVQRQMQLNQQLGQLTGALNRQQYAFQLAGGAQSQAGENLRTMMTSNPYASSTFRY